MSDVPSNVEAMVDTAAEASAEASAPIAEAVAAVTDAVVATTKRAYKPRAKASKSKAAAIKIAEPVVAPVVKAVRQAKRVATAKIERRKYVRKATAATKQAAAPLIEGIKTMNDTNWFSNLTTTMPGMDKMQAMFSTDKLFGSDKISAVMGDVSAKGQDAVKKGQVFAEQVSEAAKANMEAVVEASKIAAAGARDLGTEIVATTKSSVEHTTAAMKSLTEAKSPTEFFQLQSEMLKASFDRMVADGSKLTEQMVKLAGEATQPLSNRASVNAEKFSELTSA